MTDVCERCGLEFGHTRRCYRWLLGVLAAQDCPPVAIDPDRDYGNPPF